MPEFTNRCFVCGLEINPLIADRNLKLNLPVCADCLGTDREKQATEELLEGMADGFVCGCI